MAQTYQSETARIRMHQGLCPECGKTALIHDPDNRFWLPRGCDLTQAGVTDRIEQFRTDLTMAERNDLDFELRMAGAGSHPDWCKCQRVCGGDQ